VEEVTSAQTEAEITDRQKKKLQTSKKRRGRKKKNNDKGLQKFLHKKQQIRRNYFTDKI